MESLRFRRQLRTLRSDAEATLWCVLRDRRLGGHKFRRQHPVGPYVLDFYCAARRLAVEADGGSHFVGDGPVRDRARTEFLERRGVRVLRFLNTQILEELDIVKSVIWEALQTDRPSP